MEYFEGACVWAALPPRASDTGQDKCTDDSAITTVQLAVKDKAVVGVTLHFDDESKTPVWRGSSKGAVTLHDFVLDKGEDITQIWYAADDRGIRGLKFGTSKRKRIVFSLANPADQRGSEAERLVWPSWRKVRRLESRWLRDRRPARCLRAPRALRPVGKCCVLPTTPASDG